MSMLNLWSSQLTEFYDTILQYDQLFDQRSHLKDYHESIMSHEGSNFIDHSVPSYGFWITKLDYRRGQKEKSPENQDS